MKTSDILAKLLTKKGQFGNIVIEKTIIPLKKFSEQRIVKKTTMTYRAGIEYDSLSAVQMKRDIGELPETPQSLPWGEWVDGLYPYVIIHKGEHYARIYPVLNNVPNVVWTLNDIEVTYADVELYLTAADKPKKKDSLVEEGTKIPDVPDCMCIKLRNIYDIS